MVTDINEVSYGYNIIKVSLYNHAKPSVAAPYHITESFLAKFLKLFLDFVKYSFLPAKKIQQNLMVLNFISNNSFFPPSFFWILDPG